MSTPTYDVYLDDAVITRSLDEALDALDAALAKLSATIGVVREITPHATGALIRFTDSTTTHYLIAPHDTDDHPAWGALIQARLQRHWRSAAFAVRPADSWARTDHLWLSWTDGPAPTDVSIFLGYSFHPYVGTVRHYNRVFSFTAWNGLAALAETTGTIAVPRTADGDIDWATAATLTPDPSPVNIAGFVFDTAATPPLTVAEILRELSRRVDLTHITTDTAAQITTPTLTIADPRFGPIRVTLTDGTTAVVVGNLAVEDRAPLAPGTPVTSIGPQPDADSTEQAMALVEVGDWEVLAIAADGTLTRRFLGDGDFTITPTRWILYPVDRCPGGYALTRRPVTSTVPTRDTVAQLRGVFVDGPTTISEIFG
ncbi:hypothetical protein [Nocardia rhizosphaerihabitans]|uniref:SnoaL-like domain-containing protein n=1 Tax=Nocardia rhizosphaerihabitans TaxID=1691570 RepID=A0ABQ2KBJ7_9NOCA|nr:hypothetical protein [Nocardia rhizosphaerihabitans]GGN78338.1 hypothetical protein GCM10011610_25740 [Nocardia rhizosphaerihabitans]